MASANVYKSSAKYVLGTKTLTLDPRHLMTLWASPLPPFPTELYFYLDNHSQQRLDSGGQGKVRTRYLPVKASSEHCCLLKGLCQNSPFLPHQFFLPCLIYPLTVSHWTIQLYRPRPQASYFFGHRTGLEPGCAPGENRLVATFFRNQTDI